MELEPGDRLELWSQLDVALAEEGPPLLFTPCCSNPQAALFTEDVLECVWRDMGHTGTLRA